MNPRKSLGQHWLVDEAALKYIAEVGNIEPEDTVLEVGPGLGALTRHLTVHAKRVVAVELDKKLADELPKRILAKNLDVVNEDILSYDLKVLPRRYKVVANIPYYLTGKLLQILMSAPNPPKLMVLLLQKEVSERIAASPGQMSILATAVQLHYEVELGRIIPAKFFNPAPKVDSQVVILKRRAWPLFKDLDEKTFFQVVKAGFSNPRKKLRSSLAAGLRVPKEQTDILLTDADVNGDLRPGSLSLKQWHDIYTQYIVKKDLRSLLS